jgi:glycyl-tRNA synthetase
LIDRIKVREHMKSELSHYSSATFDMDYEYPFGSQEIAGNANRGQFDINQHMKESKQSLELHDEASKKKVIPRVIEPTFGIERVFLALLCKAYNYDAKRQNVILKLPAYLAPVKAAVFPIIKDDKMVKVAREIYEDLKEDWNVNYDESGSIGRRYSRMDEVGCPVCIAVDEQSVKDKTITLRDRDTTEQIRIKISELKEVMTKLLRGESLLKLGKKIETRVKK